MRNSSDGHAFIIHEAQPASGGHRSPSEIGNFLRLWANGPEHKALFQLIGVLACVPALSILSLFAARDLHGRLADHLLPGGLYTRAACRWRSAEFVTSWSSKSHYWLSALPRLIGSMPFLPQPRLSFLRAAAPMPDL
jgi:hypothetical protein